MSSRSKPSPLEAARQELDAALLHLQKVAAQKLVALQESDEAWAAWGRQYELAVADVESKKEQVARREAEAASAEAKAKRDRDRQRYAEVAKLCSDTVDLARTEFPKGWAIIEAVLVAFAKAEIARQEIARDLPDDFDPGDLRIVDPEMEVRSRPAIPEKVLSKKAVELWVDPKSGRPFVDQSQEPTVTANKRQFTEVTYQQFSPAAIVPRLYNALVMPRLDAFGEPILFDGPKMRDPHDVLAALQEIRERVERKPVILTRYEPVSLASTPNSETDLPPAIIEEGVRRSE